MLEGRRAASRAASLLPQRYQNGVDNPLVIKSENAHPLNDQEMPSLERQVRFRLRLQSSLKKACVWTFQFRYPWRHDSCGYPYGVVGYRAYRKSNKYRAHQIDRACRIAFPLAFLVFNLIYWTYYLKFAP